MNSKKIKYLFIVGFVILGIILFAGIVDVVRTKRALRIQQEKQLAEIPPHILEKLMVQKADAEDKIKENPNLVIPYVSLAAVEKMMGDLEEAERVLKRAAQVAPSNNLVLGNLANVYRELGKNKEAEIAYERALRFGSLEEQNYLQYADFLRYRIDDSYDRIVALYNKGLEVLDGNINIRKAYAQYLTDTEHYAEALEQWRIIAQEMPDDTAVQEEISDIQKLM